MSASDASVHMCAENEMLKRELVAMKREVAHSEERIQHLLHNEAVLLSRLKERHAHSAPQTQWILMAEYYQRRAAIERGYWEDLLALSLSARSSENSYTSVCTASTQREAIAANRLAELTAEFTSLQEDLVQFRRLRAELQSPAEVSPQTQIDDDYDFYRDELQHLSANTPRPCTPPRIATHDTSESFEQLLEVLLRRSQVQDDVLLRELGLVNSSEVVERKTCSQRQRGRHLHRPYVAMLRTGSQQTSSASSPSRRISSVDQRSRRRQFKGKECNAHDPPVTCSGLRATSGKPRGFRAALSNRSSIVL